MPSDWSGRRPLLPLQFAFATFALCLLSISCDTSTVGPSASGTTPSRDWVEQYPQPTGNDLHGVWQSPEGQVFVVGARGTIARFDGDDWTPMVSGVVEKLEAVWGSSAVDVYASGHEGTILHYDGHSWESVDHTFTRGFGGIWGSSAVDVYVWGGALYHFDGIGWSEIDIDGGVRGMWGTSRGNVYALVHDAVFHYDGTSWEESIRFSSGLKLGIWGCGEHVYVVGDEGSIHHFDGQQWEEMDSGTSRLLTLVSGVSPSEVYATGSGRVFYFDGSEWAEMEDVYGMYNGIHGDAANGVIVVGSYGKMERLRNGLREEITPPVAARKAIWGAAIDDVFVVGYGGSIMHFDGASWEPMTSGTRNDLLAVWGTGGRDVFAAGRSGTILHYDGAVWEQMDSGSAKTFMSIWGSAHNDVYAAGAVFGPIQSIGTTPGTIHHFDGARWEEIELPVNSSPLTVWGTSRRNVVAPAGIYLLRFDGTEWRYTHVDDFFYASDITGWGDVFVATGGKRIYRILSNDVITDHYVPGIVELAAIWGSRPSDYYVLSYSFEDSYLHHYKGGSSTVISVPTNRLVSDVWGIPGHGVYVVGGTSIFYLATR